MGILPSSVLSKSTVVPVLPLSGCIHVRLWRVLCYVNSRQPKIVHPLRLSSTDGGRGHVSFFFLGYNRLLVALSSSSRLLSAHRSTRLLCSSWYKLALLVHYPVNDGGVILAMIACSYGCRMWALGCGAHGPGGASIVQTQIFVAVTTNLSCQESYQEKVLYTKSCSVTLKPVVLPACFI